jgi:hypothetical protein
MDSPTGDADPTFETRVPLVSRGLTLFVAVTSLPVLALVAFLTHVENDPWWVVLLAAVILFAPLLVLRRLRLHVEVGAETLRYRVRPWHRRPRTVALDRLTRVEPLSQRPRSRITLRRVNLGRDWVDWNDEEVRYVLSGDSGVRLVRETGRDVVLWFSAADELARVIVDARDERR